MGITQDEFDEIAKNANFAKCADGEPHIYQEKLKFINQGNVYSIGECERCGDMTWSWYPITDRPQIVDKDGNIK